MGKEKADQKAANDAAAKSLFGFKRLLLPVQIPPVAPVAPVDV